MTFFSNFKSNVTNGPITRNDVFTAVAGLFLGGPVGAVLSPVAYRGFQRRLAPWAMTGVVAALPLSAVTIGMLNSTGYKTTVAPSVASVPSTSVAPAAPTEPVAAPAPASVTVPVATRASFNRSNWSRVRSGMTKSQVEAIIGRGKLLGSTEMMGTRTDIIQYGSYLSNYGSITYSNGTVFSLTSNFG